MSENYIGQAPPIIQPDIFNVGRLLQVAEHVRNDVASGNVQIPGDDTPPQITEGFEFFTLAFTPQRVGNRLRVRVMANLISAGPGTFAVYGALFVAGTPDALAVAGVTMPADSTQTLSFDYALTVTSLTPVTYSARFGSGASNVVRLNSNSLGRLFGGKSVSFLRVEEYGQ